MLAFPITALFYIFEGTVALLYGIKSYYTFKETRNEFHRLFFHLGIGVALAFYFYGFPNLLYPTRYNLSGVFYILSFIPLFWGLGEALKVTLLAWNYEDLERFTSFLIPLFTVLFVIWHFSAIPAASIDEFGLIHWGVKAPYDIVQVLFGLLITLLPGLFLLLTDAPSKKAFYKKILFGLTFVLGGIGGYGVTLLDETFLPLLAAYLVEFIGFVFLSILFLIDIFMKEE